MTDLEVKEDVKGLKIIIKTMNYFSILYVSFQLKAKTKNSVDVCQIKDCLTLSFNVLVLA